MAKENLPITATDDDISVLPQEVRLEQKEIDQKARSHDRAGRISWVMLSLLGVGLVGFVCGVGGMIAKTPDMQTGVGSNFDGNQRFLAARLIADQDSVEMLLNQGVFNFDPEGEVPIEALKVATYMKETHRLLAEGNTNEVISWVDSYAEKRLDMLRRTDQSQTAFNFAWQDLKIKIAEYEKDCLIQPIPTYCSDFNVVIDTLSDKGVPQEVENNIRRIVQGL